jgi:type IV secretory pathway VirB2 component (pilin)
MDQAQTESPPRLGWGYIVGSLIVVILLGLLAVLRTPATEVDTAERIGMLFGGAFFLAILWLIVYGVSRAIGKRKPPSTIAKIVFWILLVLLFLNAAEFVGSAAKRQGQAAFTAEERQGLRVDTDSIRHVTLGFSLPHPGPTFTASPDIEHRIAEQTGGRTPQYINWAFSDTAGHQALIIQVTGVPGLNEQKFGGFARGLRKGMAQGKMISDFTVWEGTHRELRMVVQHPNGLYMVTRCVPSVKPRREYIVCAQTFSGEPTVVTAVSNGLTIVQ